MFDFHIPTAFLIIGLLYLILPTVTWIVLADQRSVQVALWCGGGLMIGIAGILTGMTVKLPGVPLSAYFLIAANFARMQSLRLDLGLPSRTRTLVTAIILFFSCFEFLHLVLLDALWRVRFNAAVNAALIFYLAALAQRIGKTEQSRSAYWISGVYSFVGIGLLLRLVTVGQDGGPINLIGDGWSTQVLALAVVLSSVMGHVGYVGMALDRSRRREIQAAADQARKEESLRLSAQIAHLDRQRSLGQMSASLGHELKQPLTAILTNAQVAQRGWQSGALDTQRLGVFLDKIVHNTQRASQIIERIRDYIRPSQERSEPVMLNHVVHEVVALVADDALGKQIHIELPAMEPPVWVMGDPIALSQIVLNVFRNAIDALADAQKRDIVVECDKEKTWATLRIRDSGPGVADNLLSQVGTPFFSTKTTGMGMGLSISRTIAEQYGGKLTLRNTAAGQGSGAVVELTLPLLLAPTP